MRPILCPLFCAALLVTAAPALADEQMLPGAIELVAELPINPGNLAVTPDGRVFTTVHQFRRAAVQLIEVTGPQRWQPWPDGAWNGPFGSGPDVLNSVLGIAADHRGRLWVLDNGLGDPPQPPKLIAFDIADGQPVWRHGFPPEAAPPGSFLNDLAVDDRRGFVYIADPGGTVEPALVVVDVNAGTSRRFTASTALQAEDLDLVVDGRVLGKPGADGQFQPARVGVNPITLSADGETLFFGAMTGATWYRLPTRLLREGADDATIAAAIAPVGPKPVSDGALTDPWGRHYFTDLAHNAITMLLADGTLEPLVSDPRVQWPDALSLGPPGWLYVAVNQLHRAPLLNGGVDGGQPPYLILRVAMLPAPGE